VFPNLLGPVSARIEPAGLRHLVPVLIVGAELPGQSAEAGNDAEEDECVGLPVRGLCIPATGWRPDVLGIRNSRTTTHID